MKKKLVFRVIGKFLIIEAILMILPMICSVIYSEWNSLISFVISAVVCGIVGFALSLLKSKSSEFYAKEGLMIIGLIWVFWSLFGALPFFISGEIPHYIDAVFETVSGFTTTGATILTDVEAMSHGMLFWRAFSHWIGGMGVLVFAMALISVSDKNSIHLMRAEVPGPVVSKLVPRGMKNAKILYGLYTGLCVLEFLFLVLGGMPIFDSIIHTFSTAGTGGFSCKNASIAAYNSPYIEWVITAFMFLFSINFNMYYFLLIKKGKLVAKNSEWKIFTAIVLISTALFTVSIYKSYPTVHDAIRTAAFQTLALISTTGFGTADFDKWNGFSKLIVLTLMFLGACAGSTGGGIKISRITILIKSAVRSVRNIVRPKSVINIKIDGKVIEDDTVRQATGYFLVYIALFVISLLLVAINNLNVDETVSAVSTCFNNVGPGFGIVGPTGNFASLSILTKIVLSFDMLLGRLELFPILILFVPAMWKNKFI